jgi:hypothetical protein
MRLRGIHHLVVTGGTNVVGVIPTATSVVGQAVR